MEDDDFVVELKSMQIMEGALAEALGPDQVSASRLRVLAEAAFAAASVLRVEPAI